MRAVLVVMFACITTGCGGSASSPSSSLNLTGSWSGMVGQPQSGSALRLTWIATQSGTTVSGPATLVKPSTDVPATGTMAGTLTGSRLTLTYEVPAGSVPVYLSCTISGSGTATATAQSMVGALQLVFTNCLGSGLETTESPQFTLAKQ